MKSGHGRKIRRIPAAYAVDLGKAELLRLYREDGEFSERFERLRQKHETAICHLLRDTSDLGTTDRRASDNSETEIMKVLEKTSPGISRVLEISAKVLDLEKAMSGHRLEELLSSRFPAAHVEGLVELAKELRSLAISFGLDYPWAVPHLLSIAIVKTANKVVPASNPDRILELVKQLCAEELAKSVNIPPLVITIPAFFVLWPSESEILKHVREQLHAYKDDLARHGISLETRDALYRQICWLFAWKRHRYTAKQILDSDYYLGDCVVGYTHIADAIRDWERRFSGDVRRT